MSDAPRIVERGLDLLNEGFGIFDAELNLLACNQRFGELQGYPADLSVPGTPLERMFRFSAERGDFGPGDVDAQVSERMAELSRWCAARQSRRGIDRRSSEGRILNLYCRPIAGGGVALIYDDVTEARAVEEALRASELRSALVARAAAEGIYDWDVTNDDLYVSSRLNEIFGFEDGEVRSRGWRSRVHPDDAEKYRRAVRAHFKGQTSRLECEYRIRDQRGQHVWVLDHGVAVRNNAGRTVRLVGAVSDITAQKDAEAALRKSEERYALAMEAVNEAVFDWDVASDRVFYSPRLLEMLGEEGVFRTSREWLTRIHPDDAPRFRQALLAHLKGVAKRFECEYRYRRTDGGWGWARHHALGLRDQDGRIYRMAGSWGEITEQKELEQALRAAETRFAEATEAVTAGIALFDADDRLVMCNHRFRDTYPAVADLMRPGIRFRDILQASIDRGVVADARADPQGWLARRLERHLNPGTPLEWQLDDGRWLHVSEHRTAEGGIIGIYTDITARKQAEREAVAAKERAERALADLQEAQEKLIHAEKMASLGQLTAGIAHEIKNPLNFVNNFADLSVELCDELGELLGPIVPTLRDPVRADLDEAMSTLAGNLGRIAEHGRRADRIVKNMLLHSREDPGELRPIDLNGLVAESLNLAYHGARAERPGFTVEMIKDLDPAAGEVWGQPQDLIRVFLNLISNGFYAAHQRKVAADGDDFEPALTVTTRDLEGLVEVRIRDNGPGIPEPVRSRIFQPFFTTKPAGEGTGLGLSLSYDIIVKQHGGTIDVASRPGEFTEFIVTLPRAAAAEAGAKGAAAQ